MKKLIFILFLSLCIPLSKVDALRCDYSELSRLKKIASNINVSYDYIETEYDVTFNVTLVNMSDELYLVEQDTEIKHEYAGTEFTISGYKSGKSIIYLVYSKEKICGNEPIYTIRVKLPPYNFYYKDELCNGISNYSLCQKWSSNFLSYYEFEKKVKAYKESLIKNEEVEKKEEEENLVLYIIIKFILDNYVIILLTIITISGISIYIINKKSDVYS